MSQLLEYLIGEGADVEHAHRLYKPILPFARHIGAKQGDYRHACCAWSDDEEFRLG